MNELEKLEQKFDFQYPTVYRELYKDNMLNWGETGTDWYNNIYPTLLENPPLLLHSRDFELFTFSEIGNRLEDIPDYWDIRHKFIPFAMSAGGDWYAFYYNAQEGNNIPVVFVPHDEMNATFLARNMNDFIFRMMLEYASEIDEDLLEDEDEFRKNILNMLKSHRPYISPYQFDILDEIYHRPIQEYEYGLTLVRSYKESGLLGEPELNKLIKENIDFDKLDTEFLYQKPY